jgi:mRNA-degrading endonuclease RelE of RelBE toxin-antitoxin system
MKEINYETTPEFDRDLKKLCKKYKSLPGDIEMLKKAVIELYLVLKLDNNAVFPIPGYCCEEVISYKIKKFACRSLKGKGAKSGLRLIYLYEKKGNKVLFIEIYYKGNQANEDKNRLKYYYAKWLLNKTGSTLD